MSDCSPVDGYSWLVHAAAGNPQLQEGVMDLVAENERLRRISSELRRNFIEYRRLYREAMVAVEVLSDGIVDMQRVARREGLDIEVAWHQ